MEVCHDKIGIMVLHITQTLGVPVVDGVTAAVELVQSLVSLGLKTSKYGELAAPLPKPMIGLLQEFTLKHN